MDYSIDFSRFSTPNGVGSLSNNAITKADQNRVPRQDKISTPEEAVRYLAGELKKNRA